MKNLYTTLNKTLSKMMFSISTLCFSSITFAAPKDQDIVKTLLNGAMGKTLGKEGMIWGLLTVMSFASGAFWAAIKHDPKAFIPAFISAGIISTIVGVFITF